MKVFSPFQLDPINQCLWRDKARISMPPKQFAVLSYLVEHPGRLVTQEEILSAVWPETFVQPEVLRKYILELRKVLGDRPKSPLFIETFPKRGYQFVAPVHDESASRATAHRGPEELAQTPVGRKRSLTQLDGCLGRSEQGQRQIVFVTGEAGIGKSTLIDTFQQGVAANGAIVARGQCVEGFGGKEAYYPVLEAIGELLRGPAAVSVTHAIASRAPAWLIQFPGLVKSEPHGSLQPELLGATRERMVREFCEALELISAEHPLVLMLEDLHWSDVSTLDLISALARRRNPTKLLVIATYRPVEVILLQSPLKALKHDLVIHRLCDEIALERLTEADVAEYLQREFPGVKSLNALASLIHRHSEGNPLFMTAIAGELTDTGVLAEENGQWKLTQPVLKVRLGVPDTLQQMLELQVEQLNEFEQRLLKSASVAGNRFSAWSVAAMLDVDVAEAEENCEKLAQRQQFLRRSRATGVIGEMVSASYEFRHSLYREALYRRLPSAHRAALHHSLAVKAEEFLNRANPSSAREFASELALHFENGREMGRAAHYLILSAENAARRYAHADAIAILEHALALLSRTNEEISSNLENEILEKISDGYYALGQMEQSAEIDGRAAKIAEERGMKTAQVNALTRVARALAFTDPDDCVTVCERAAKVCSSIDDPLLRARTEMLAACWRIVNNGWNRKDADICASARDRIRAINGRDLPAYYEVLYAHVQFLQGEYVDACAIADAGIQKASEVHSLVVYLSSLSSKSLALIHLGQWGELERVLKSAIDLAEKNGNHPWVGIFRVMLAWLHVQSCDFEGARNLAEQILENHPENPPGQISSIAFLTMGYSDLAMGHAERAIPLFRQVRDRQLKPKIFLQWYWRMLAEIGLVDGWLESGELETASAAADQFLAEALLTADPALRASAWDTSARVAAIRGNLERAIECSDQAIAEIQNFDLPSVSWRIQSTAASIKVRAGRTAETRNHSEKATAALRRVAESFEEANPMRQSLFAAADDLKVKLERELEISRVPGAGNRPKTRRAK